MNDSNPASAPERLDATGLRSVLKRIPGLVAVPAFATVADLISPEVMIGGAVLVAGLERAYRSGSLQRLLDRQVNANRLKPTQRDRVMSLASAIDKQVPLMGGDLLLLATLIPEIKLLAPLVDRVPSLRAVATAVREIVTARGVLGLGGAGKRGVVADGLAA